MNPLNQVGNRVRISLMNPNPRSYKTKHGPVYRVTFDLLKEDYEDFMDADTAGWTAEADVLVTGVNEKIQDNREPEKKEEKPYADKAIGPLCREALDAAEDPDWWDFLSDYLPVTMDRKTSHFAAKAIRSACAVGTRKALDYDKDAAIRWGKLSSRFDLWVQNKRAAGI